MSKMSGAGRQCYLMIKIQHVCPGFSDDTCVVTFSQFYQVKIFLIWQLLTFFFFESYQNHLEIFQKKKRIWAAACSLGGVAVA